MSEPHLSLFFYTLPKAGTAGAVPAVFLPAAKKGLHFVQKGYILYFSKTINRFAQPNIRILQGRVQFPTGGKARERTPFGESMIR